jgi:hypothetical protein
VVADLVAREYLDSLRMIYHLRRRGEGRRVKGAAMQALWRWVSIPWFLPYYIYWEIKWRGILRKRVQESGRRPLSHTLV